MLLKSTRTGCQKNGFASTTCARSLVVDEEKKKKRLPRLLPSRFEALLSLLSPLSLRLSAVGTARGFELEKERRREREREEKACD